MKKIFGISVFIFFLTTLPASADYIIYCKDGSEVFVKSYQITETDVTYITNHGIYHLPLDKVNIEKTEYERDMRDHGPRWQEMQRKAEEKRKEAQRQALERAKAEAEKRKKEEEAIRKQREKEEKLRVEQEQVKKQYEESISKIIKEKEQKNQQIVINFIKNYKGGKIEKTIKNLLELQRIEGDLVRDIGWSDPSCYFDCCSVEYIFRSRDILYKIKFEACPDKGEVRPLNQLAHDILK